jgi:hypothetical protein
MNIAIMQPYLFPYIGYFQLINHVDSYVFLDDVQYIRRGWVNRNRILNNSGSDFTFTFPVKKAPQETKIIDMLLADTFDADRHKFMVQLKAFYAKAPQYSTAIDLIGHCLDAQSPSLNNLLISSNQAICKFLDIQTKTFRASEIAHDGLLANQDMIIDIAKTLKATTYTNPIGGQEIYQKAAFEAKGIKLNFLKTNAHGYRQFKNPFVPYLSIIDLLMFLDKAEIRSLLVEYQLVEPLSI